ncbi:MAG: CaiB/BaiF CoA-transferase family protein [Desulfopila sp.]|jgi:crotonobetainyl-CoA:carnitine CoA-transferase CaiB-like acyl-CoA transferase|nr:CaiB/BaiF CoA-transferase family protein [Desulfopila sp.]
MGALDGIRVLDLSRLLPGPFASMVLADHGAEVLSLEDRRFQKDDLYFDDVYRNKKHMTLNLKSEMGKKIFFQLAADVDIILEGFRPGVVDRLGVAYKDVCRVNPAVIYCSITGYGQSGPDAQRAGHDVNYLSRAGVLDSIGGVGEPPAIPAMQCADIAGGAMNGVIGILLALYEREKSGKGQYIDISMTDGVVPLLTLPYILGKKTGRVQGRSESMLSHRYACYNTYETADGRYISLGAVENRFWSQLCTLLQVEEYIPLQYDEHRREEITARIRLIFQSRPLSYWDDLLAEADVCYSKISTLEEVLSDQLFWDREMVVNQSERSGSGKTFGVPVKLGRTPGKVRSAPVSFGESTREVLASLGYSENEIHNFFNAGVV